MSVIQVPEREIMWLLECSDTQMRDGDTARDMITVWLKGKSAIHIINTQQRNLNLPDFKPEEKLDDN